MLCLQRKMVAQIGRVAVDLAGVKEIIVCFAGVTNGDECGLKMSKV